MRHFAESIIAIAICLWGAIAIYHLLPPSRDVNEPMYRLRCPPAAPRWNPCMEPSVDHRFHILANEMLEDRLSIKFAAVILNSPIDRLRRDELIMLCQIVKDDCRDISPKK